MTTTFRIGDRVEYVVSARYAQVPVHVPARVVNITRSRIVVQPDDPTLHHRSVKPDRIRRMPHAQR